MFDKIVVPMASISYFSHPISPPFASSPLMPHSTRQVLGWQPRAASQREDRKQHLKTEYSTFLQLFLSRIQERLF